MEGCFMFQCGRGGGGCFSDRGGFIFKWGGAPHEGHQFGGGGFGKNCKMGGAPPPMPPSMGNPAM